MPRMSGAEHVRDMHIDVIDHNVASQTTFSTFYIALKYILQPLFALRVKLRVPACWSSIVCVPRCQLLTHLLTHVSNDDDYLNLDLMLDK